MKLSKSFISADDHQKRQRRANTYAWSARTTFLCAMTRKSKPLFCGTRSSTFAFSFFISISFIPVAYLLLAGRPLPLLLPFLIFLSSLGVPTFSSFFVAFSSAWYPLVSYFLFWTHTMGLIVSTFGIVYTYVVTIIDASMTATKKWAIVIEVHATFRSIRILIMVHCFKGLRDCWRLFRFSLNCFPIMNFLIIFQLWENPDKRKENTNEKRS